MTQRKRDPRNENPNEGIGSHEPEPVYEQGEACRLDRVIEASGEDSPPWGESAEFESGKWILLP